MTWGLIVLAFIGGGIFGFLIATLFTASKIAEIMALLDRIRSDTE